MTRGKYAVRAQNRRDAAEVTQTIEAYQRKIREQLAEINRLKADAATAAANHELAARKLIAQRDEAISPRLKVVEREAVTLRQERDAALTDAKEISKRWHRILEALIHHGETAHHMTRLEAMEWLLWLIDPTKSATIVDNPFMKDLVDKWPGPPGEAVRLIERARGLRRP